MHPHVALAYFPKITPSRHRRLMSRIATLADFFALELDDLSKLDLEESVAHEFLAWRDTLSIEKLEQELAREEITAIHQGDPEYPKQLQEIPDAPFVLFVRGTLPPSEMPLLGVVGTRRCTVYGRNVTHDFTRSLAQSGIGIVSGLALGIDAVAHEAALEGNGYTLAVLGSGVNQSSIAPITNLPIAKKILAQGGAIVSEYPPGFSATEYTFPARNRIIAGLCAGTLVTEAPIHSGALITAFAALEYNREVFAVPHPITSPTGKGTNKLLKLGAAIATEPEDIITILNLEAVLPTKKVTKVMAESPAEEKIIACLSQNFQPVTALIEATGLDSSVIQSTLTLMEIRGIIKNNGGLISLTSTL